MLIVGGMTTVSGAFFGAVAVTLTVEILRRVEGGVESVRLADARDVRAHPGRPLRPDPARHVSPAGRPVRAARDSARPWLRRCARAQCAHAGSVRLSAAPPRGELRAEGMRPRISPASARSTASSSACGRGRSSGLIGPNGSGKTTLLNIISGVFVAERRAHPDRRRGMRRGGRRIRSRAPASAAPSRTSACSASLSVLENVEISGPRRADARQRLRPARLCAPIAGASSASLILPTGRRRRLGLRRPAPAGDRAGAGAPAALPAARRAGRRHEPDRIQPAAARARAAARGAPASRLLVIDHDMSLIMRLCDRIVVLNRGQVIAEGKPAEIQTQSGRHRGLYRPQACQTHVPTATSLQMQGATP